MEGDGTSELVIAFSTGEGLEAWVVALGADGSVRSLYSTVAPPEARLWIEEGSTIAIERPVAQGVSRTVIAFDEGSGVLVAREPVVFTEGATDTNDSRSSISPG